VRAHSAAVAAMVRVLALEYRPDCSDGIVLCGLFHDIGKLLLMQSGEFTYPATSWVPSAALHGVHSAERDHLGYDHAVLGGHVLQRWHLPDPMPMVVARHHQFARALSEPDRVGPKVALLRLANHLEPLYRRQPESYAELVPGIAETPEAVYLGLGETALLRSWENLYYAFHESASVFGA